VNLSLQALSFLFISLLSVSPLQNFYSRLTDDKRTKRKDCASSDLYRL